MIPKDVRDAANSMRLCDVADADAWTLARWAVQEIERIAHESTTPPTRELFERLGAEIDRFGVASLKAIDWHSECHCPAWDAIPLDTIAQLRAACLLLGIEWPEEKE